MVPITPPPLSEQALADLVSTIMVLCRGRHEDGGNFWAYMCVKPSMARAFRDARRHGCFPLEDYGTVVEWGEGDEPPREVKNRMEREYGISHDYEAELIRAIELQEVPNPS